MNDSILKISEAASLALHAMTIMSEISPEKNSGLISAKGISEVLGVSYNHLSKVLQRLVKADLVLSIKGHGGGFKLAKAPDDITFLEIYEAIDGKFKPSKCLLNKDKCISQCIMGDFIVNINRQVTEFFSTKKLSDFTNK